MGRKRTKNEDRYRINATAKLFLVADGMGGHIAGEIASKLAVDTIEDVINLTTDDETWPFEIDEKLPLPANQLLTAIKLANKKIHEIANTRGHFDGMGTTIVALLIRESTAYIAHVGDSRAYLYRNNKLSILTQDHSWVNMQINLGLMNEAEARRHPWKNIITRALGTKGGVEVDVDARPIEAGDTILLCTDGLNSCVSNEEITVIVERYRFDLETAAQRLIEQANQNGGDDNITVIIVRFEPDDYHEAPRQQQQDEEEVTEIIPKTRLDDSDQE